MAGGSTTVSFCVVTNNTAAGSSGGNGRFGGLSGEGFGGGICIEAGTMEVVSSTISANMSVGADEVGVWPSQPAANGRGGGIYLMGSLTMTNSTVAGNRASGGSAYVGSSAGRGMGGGICFDVGSATVVNSTLSGNSAVGGLGVNPSVVGGNAYGGGSYGSVAYTTAPSSAIRWLVV